MSKKLLNQRWAVLALLLLALAAFLAACGGHAGAKTQYHCPMHPTYISDRPGDCPICGMRLVILEKHDAAAAAPPPGGTATPAPPATAPPASAPGPAATPAPTAKYTCPMHPEVQSDKPGKCDKCGMDLVRTAAADPLPAGAGARPGAEPGERRVLFYRNPMDPAVTSPVPMKDAMGMDYVPVYAGEVLNAGGGIEGLAAVGIDAHGQRLAGLQTAVATRERLVRDIRTVGSVVADETRVRHVQTKISGWIDKLYVNSTGQLVREGQPALRLYSPELLASQEEFLRARQAAAQFAASSVPEVRKGGADLVEAARQRLRLFDVPESFIAALERSGTAERNVTLLAPVSGFVTTKGVFEGQRVEPGMELFTVTDLSHVWIEASFYEYEARAVHVGQEAVLGLPYDPSVRLTGQVAYVYPYVDPESRTLKVRFAFPNRDLLLKPSMYVDVSLHVDAGDAVVVPENAVMDTGARQVAFVQTDSTRFEPRLVQVGMRGEGKAQLLAGVQAGERVVVRANFLLDSESRLRAAFAGAAVAAPHAGESK